jgi:hypothetical protein
MTFGHRIFLEISVSGHFVNINFADIEMKLFTIMSYRSSLSFGVIDKYLKSYGPRA